MTNTKSSKKRRKQHKDIEEDINALTPWQKFRGYTLAWVPFVDWEQVEEKERSLKQDQIYLKEE